MYFQTFQQMKKMLGQMDKWLDAADAFAKSRNYEPNLFLEVRFAPDQFAFVRQVRAACDTAKLGASRLTGKEAPSHPDTPASSRSSSTSMALPRRISKGLPRASSRSRAGKGRS